MNRRQFLAGSAAAVAVAALPGPVVVEAVAALPDIRAQYVGGFMDEWKERHFYRWSVVGDPASWPDEPRHIADAITTLRDAPKKRPITIGGEEFYRFGARQHAFDRPDRWRDHDASALAMAT
ncbi:MAG: twin-arginine translocation signal domain-containing protein [Xanthobacteraceae bacterium]|nr:twin-arginine translocation signal domain-containing protein [Xanthobacteraceae bacterium]